MFYLLILICGLRCWVMMSLFCFSSFHSFFLLAMQSRTIIATHSGEPNECSVGREEAGNRVGKQTSRQRGREDQVKPTPGQRAREGRVWDGLGWDGWTQLLQTKVFTSKLLYIHFFYVFHIHLLSSFWTSRGHGCRPFCPSVLALNFFRA